ncbi:MAG: NAD(P)-dependent alcohol dehydrogenase [Pseudomonadales bacterium]
MPYQALAAIMRSVDDPIAIEEVELADLRDNEVLVRIEACGVCYTDVKFRSQLPLPAVLGHEGVGVVEDIGGSVNGFTKGDRVIISYPFCTRCIACERSQPFACESIPRLKFSGGRLDGSKTINLDGKPITSAFFQQSSFATRAIALEDALVKVDTDLPSEFLAALPCGIQTGAGSVLNTFEMGAHHSLAVFGVGSVGLGAIMAAKVVGAGPRIAIDIEPRRLELALSLGATNAIDGRAPDVVQQVKAIAPRGVSHVLETTADTAVLERAIECLAQGGRAGIVSAPPSGQRNPFTTRGLFERVASLHGIVQGFAVPRLFLPKLIEMQSRGAFPFERLVTPYPFMEINRAMADFAAGTIVKPVLVMRDIAAPHAGHSMP